jgi:hypothetical protein
LEKSYKKGFEGWCPATEALERFGAAARVDPVQDPSKYSVEELELIREALQLMLEERRERPAAAG